MEAKIRENQLNLILVSIKFFKPKSESEKSLINAIKIKDNFKYTYDIIKQNMLLVNPQLRALFEDYMDVYEDITWN